MIAQELSSIELPKEFASWALDHYKDQNKNEFDTRKRRVAGLRREHEGVTNKLESLIEMRANKEIDSEEFGNKKREWITDQHRLEELMTDTEDQTRKWLDRAEELLEYACNAHTAFQVGSFEMKRKMLLGLGSNLILKDMKLDIELRNELKPILKIKTETDAISERFEPLKFPDKRQRKELLANAYSSNANILGQEDSNLSE